jgi:hypothetical protein
VSFFPRANNRSSAGLNPALLFGNRCRHSHACVASIRFWSFEDSNMSFKKIMVAVDESAFAAHAADVGTELAKSLNAELALST